MSVSHAARVRGAERRLVDEPDSAVAAWHVKMPGGAVLLTLNVAQLGCPGALEWAESWFRLDALARGRPYGVLHVDDVVRFGPYLVGHRHEVAG
jgi:hypothetical protein